MRSTTRSRTTRTSSGRSSTGRTRATFRGNGTQGGAFKAFDFADVVWLNYRGSDDNSTIKIPDDKVKFFPVGAPGVFRESMCARRVDGMDQPAGP